MRELFKSKLFLFLLIAVVLLTVVAVATSKSQRAATWLEDALGTVAQPVQRFSVRASNGVIDFFQRVFKTTDADKENEQLKVRIAQYETMENELNDLRQENERLKSIPKEDDFVERFVEHGIDCLSEMT